MIVTRSWLQEYVDLKDISDSELSDKLNSIGLEVEAEKRYEIPAKVVVGEILECNKHPDADKLNVCQVNVGSEVVQIVCGAKNVVDAKYVAVSTVGSVLPGDFKIKKAKLRGVESFGMICSSSELGLPELDDGIMILDDSIGELIVGKELNEYEKFADFVVEVDITANRGDCTSIYGVARDLAAAFGKEIKLEDKRLNNISKVAIAKQLVVDEKDEFDGVLEYAVLDKESIEPTFLERLRCSFCELEYKNNLDLKLKYSSLGSGVILRAYDHDKLPKDELSRVSLSVVKSGEYLLEIKCDSKVLSTVGVNSNSEYCADDSSSKIIIEASYINPDFVTECVSSLKLDSDSFYYNSSRGSEPNVSFGLERLFEILSDDKCSIYSSTIKVGKRAECRVVSIDMSDINSIVGVDIRKSEIASILLSLGFSMSKIDGDKYRVEIPSHRHDIVNIYDISEEIVRIYGIGNIKAKPLPFLEKNRLNSVYEKYSKRKEITQKAIGAGFYEAVTYAFSNRELLQKYGFEVVQESLDIVNPIVKELNTLRTTILLNLLESASRNVKYGKKSIALFEIGTLFNSKREESQKIAFIYSGEESRASVINSAKAKNIDFSGFVAMLNRVIGDFSLVESEVINGIEHPFVVANVFKDGNIVGRIFKLHPKVAVEFDLDDTYMAELDFDAILPKHKDAKKLSNYQAVNKDLSILVSKELSFYKIAKELKDLVDSEDTLRDFYPLDIYRDDSLGDKESLTIRFTIQSDESTLNDEDIDGVMSKVLNRLEDRFEATLR